MLNVLNALATVLFAVSLAVERLLSIIKTVFPWLTEEKKTPAGEIDLVADKPRRIIVQLLALAASWVTCALLFNQLNPVGTVLIGDREFAIGLLALLGSGGSAFWNNFLGYTKGLKDQQRVLTAANTLGFHEAADAAGKPARDSGATARAPGRRDDIRAALAQLRAQPAPVLNLGVPRGNSALLRSVKTNDGGE